MLVKTRGIVFRSIKYSETSLICDVYTEALGLQTYIVSGVRSKRASTKASLLQVMSLLDMVVYHRLNKEMHRTKELKPALVYSGIPFDVVKSSIGLFMVELARKTIREQEENALLFNFLFQCFTKLDEIEEGVANFHLFFALHLSGFLGFMPSGTYSTDTPIFDLQEGVFTSKKPKHYHFIEQEIALLFNSLLEANIDDIQEIKINRSLRFALTEKIILYFRLHIENLSVINSHEILKEVLS